MNKMFYFNGHYSNANSCEINKRHKRQLKNYVRDIVRSSKKPYKAGKGNHDYQDIE